MYTGFSTATTAMFGQQQTLMLHLFTSTNNALWSTLGLALCMAFWMGLTCYRDGSVHRFTGCFWRKSYQKWWRKSCWHPRETCGSGTTGLQFTLHVRSENISLPLTMITGFDREGVWLRLPGHQTSHQHTSSCVTTLQPWLSCHQLILKRILLPILLGQQQPSGRNLAFLSHINLCSVVIACVSRLEVVRLNICSKLVWNTTFRQNTSMVLLDFQF